MFNFLKHKKPSDDNSYVIDPALLKEYNMHRPSGPQPVLCYAPFKSMYFDLNGRVGACGLSFKEYETWPEKSIKEIWNGEKFQKHRNLILKNDLSYEFNVCRNHIMNRNFLASKSNWYDKLSMNKEYPVLMEFEIDNTCNLECIMCNATKSSSIRKRKNIGTAYQSPYNKDFVLQLEEFIPHLEKAIFIGGEPFLIDLCYDIWERMSELNPGMMINVNTNGTILNDKVRNVLEKSNFEINLSIDSLKRSVYENIRLNANFDKTMQNLHFFQNYCNEKKTNLYLSPCPMKKNWEEMPDFVNFCNELGITLFLYTLFQPYELALWTCDSNELYYIIKKLETFEFTGNTEITKHNKAQFDSFLQQLRTWFDDAINREKKIHQNIKNDGKGSEKEILLRKIESFLKGCSDGKENNLPYYISILENLIKNLPEEISPEVLFSKLNSFDISIIIEQLEVNDEKELLDQAKMLYFSSYLA